MAGAPITDASVSELLETRDLLQNLFLFLGAVVGLAILAAAGERSAIGAFSDLTAEKDPGSFPQEYVLVYGIYFSILVTTAIVVETVFAWPGLGRLAYEGISGRDFPVIQAVVLVTGAIVAVVNLGVDCLYAFIDPRIRVG